MNNKLPVIFIFDLDKTLIGDTSNGNILEYRDFLEFVHNACKHKRFSGSECKFPRTVLNKHIMPQQFFRPYLKESLLSIKKLFPTAEFFIFSLGTNDYVSAIIEYLESYTGIKFNRPFFSRQDSSFSETVSYMKEIKGYEDIIFKSIVKRYPKCKIEHFRNLVMNKRTIIVDDTDVWNNDFRWIQCKAYSYAPICEINGKMLEMIYSHDSIKKYIMHKNSKIIPQVSSTLDAFKMNYHIMLANQYRAVLDNNIEQCKDIFFPKFVRVIKNRSGKLKPFTRAYLQKIQRSFI